MHAFRHPERSDSEAEGSPSSKDKSQSSGLVFLIKASFSLGVMVWKN